MRRSGLFAPARRADRTGEVSNSAEYLQAMGYISPVGAGLLTHLPLGLATFNNLRSVLNRHLEDLANCSFHEFPALHPRSLWEGAGRLEKFGETIFRLADQHGRPLILAPTHEVTAAHLAAEFVQSYRDLPIRISQIQIKYRDEARPRAGVIRTRQFTMHDLYSFDTDEQAAKVGYDLVKEAYVRTFSDIRVPVFVAQQRDTGAIGGDLSHEFQVPAAIGDDKVTDPTGAEHPSLECAHIFMLGTSYSEAANAYYMGADSAKKPVYMCSFGLGIERTVAAYVETYLNRDGELVWSWALAPFQLMIIGRSARALDVYRSLKAAGYRVLIEDRDVPLGQGMAEGFAFGFPMYLIFGKTAGPGEVELICRRARFSEVVPIDEIPEAVRRVSSDLAAIEQAECWGRLIELDRTRKCLMASFEEPWMLTAGPLHELPVGADLMGRFGEPKKGNPGKRLKAGEYWIVPVVRENVAEPTPKTHAGLLYMAAPANDNFDPTDFWQLYQQHRVAGR